jgi:hypothetical protein
MSLDLASVNIGDIVTLMTDSGRWYLTRIAGSSAHRDTITGVMVSTNSRRFAQAGADPRSFIVDRMASLGQDFQVGSSWTGTVNTVLVNGEYRVG